MRQGWDGRRRSGLAAPAAAVGALLVATLVAPGCSRDIGARCNQDTECRFGLACVFEDFVQVDCCAVTANGTLNCDPDEVDIAPDCEWDGRGLPIPRFRRVTCLRDVFDEYTVWAADYANVPCTVDSDCGNQVCDQTLGFCPPVLTPIELASDFGDGCTCEPGATFEYDPIKPKTTYDPVLAAGFDTGMCSRDEHTENTNAVADVDSCPPQLAFLRVCGNNVVEVSEQCDLDETGELLVRGPGTCEAHCAGTTSGTLACTPECNFDCAGCM